MYTELVHGLLSVCCIEGFIIKPCLYPAMFDMHIWCIIVYISCVCYVSTWVSCTYIWVAFMKFKYYCIIVVPYIFGHNVHKLVVFNEDLLLCIYISTLCSCYNRIYWSNLLQNSGLYEVDIFLHCYLSTRTAKYYITTCKAVKMNFMKNYFIIWCLVYCPK